MQEFCSVKVKVEKGELKIEWIVKLKCEKGLLGKWFLILKSIQGEVKYFFIWVKHELDCSKNITYLITCCLLCDIILLKLNIFYTMATFNLLTSCQYVKIGCVYFSKHVKVEFQLCKRNHCFNCVWLTYPWGRTLKLHLILVAYKVYYITKHLVLSTNSQCFHRIIPLYLPSPFITSACLKTVTV